MSIALLANIKEGLNKPLKPAVLHPSFCTLNESNWSIWCNLAYVSHNWYF